MQVSLSSPHAPSNEAVIYRPADAAKALGINEDSVTRHAKQRPRLFPTRAGGRHEWTPEEFRRVLQVLRSLSPKARVSRAA